MGLTPFFPLCLQEQEKQVFNHSFGERNWLLGSKLADVTKQQLTQVVGQLSTVLAKEDTRATQYPDFFRRRSENSLVLILK